MDETLEPSGRCWRIAGAGASASKSPTPLAVACIADGFESDGNPSLRYLTPLREGARMACQNLGCVSLTLPEGKV